VISGRSAIGFVVLGVLACGGCTCGKSSGGAATAPSSSASAASASASPSASAAPPDNGPVDAKSGARFSAPIAATRLANGSVVAAALTASAPDAGAGDAGPRVDSIVATSFDARGVAWSVEVLRGIAWSQEVELRVLPAGDGAAVVWRGALDGKIARYLVVVDAKGAPKGKPVEVGSALCATLDGLAWIDRPPGEQARVRMRAWADADASELMRLPAEPPPTLVCSEHRVYALVAGEDELTVTTGVAGDAGAPVVMSRDKDFPDDDDSDNQPFTTGDRLGLVRIGESGTIAVRDLDGADLSPWKTLKHKIVPDDDVVVAVDGDAASFVVVYTHDQSDLCKDPGATGRSLHALRFDRASGSESRLLLAPADCGKEIGPFWLGAPQRGFVAAWAERGKRSDATSAPIRALLHLPLAASDGGAPGRVDQAADAIADAGCDGTTCWAVALVRESGADGMAPEALRVLRYP